MYCVLCWNNNKLGVAFSRVSACFMAKYSLQRTVMSQPISKDFAYIPLVEILHLQNTRKDRGSY